MAAVILAVMDDNEDVSDLSYTTRVLMWDEEERPPCLGIPGLQARLLLPATWPCCREIHTGKGDVVHGAASTDLLGGPSCCRGSRWRRAAAVHLLRLCPQRPHPG